MSCNGGPVDRFDLNKDPGLFHDVYVSPFYSGTHRIATVRLPWVDDF